MMKGNLIRKAAHYLMIGLVLVLAAGCISSFFVIVNRPILDAKKSAAGSDPIDLAAWEENVGARLRQAPWQGLRYLPEINEWRFFAITGETRKINLIVPFDLIKVYYLEADGDLDFTWVNTAADIPGVGRLEMTSGAIETGQLVEVVLRGEHVARSGVRWDLCDSEYCRVANLIDTIIILDDEGTGITNGFIRNGWEPPASPMYGFLCWEIRPAGSDAVAVTSQIGRAHV
jgi:hypothetical protein